MEVNTKTKKIYDLRDKLIRYYEVDLDNCNMTHEMWIKELVECMINSDNYVKDFNLNLKQYDDERNA